MKQLYILLLLVTATCCTRTLEKDDYVAWVEDEKNGLHVTTLVGDYQYDLQYQPSDYVLLQRSAGILSAGQLVAQMRDVEHIQYYRLTLDVAGTPTDFISHRAGDAASKREKLYYFSYHFQQDMYLEENGERLPCVLFHFEKGVDLKTGRTFVLGFENPYPDSKECHLVLTSDWLHHEPVRLTVTKQPTPSLAL